MLAAPALRRRIFSQPWSTLPRRLYAQGGRGSNGYKRDGDKRNARTRGQPIDRKIVRDVERKARWKPASGEDKSYVSLDLSKPDRSKYQPDGPASEPGTPTPEGPSLIEQLFPERYGAGGTHRNAIREVPQVPVEADFVSATPKLGEPMKRPVQRTERMRQFMEDQTPVTSALVLRHASKSLVEEDFRRVIPQGQHLEGWTLEQGDILRVIPSRDLETLAPTGTYTLLFSSPLSAFTYQGHVTRIHKMVAAHTPNSLSSPLAPPPGYMLEGMDAHDAMASFTLRAPDQRLNLRQLKPPLAPFMESMIRHGGYPPLMQRKDRMQHEARLTLEGPQLQPSVLRQVFLYSARDRGCNWSGGDAQLPQITKWEPLAAPSESDHSPTATWRTAQLEAEGRGETTDEMKFAEMQDAGLREEKVQLNRRTPQLVYIVGFATEQALHSFVHFWHERPMTWKGVGREVQGVEGDIPPVAQVEVLW